MRSTFCLALSGFLLLGCGDDDSGDTSLDAPDATIVSDADIEDSVATNDASVDAIDDANAGSDADLTPDAMPPDPCEGSIICEGFESYDFGSIRHAQEFGPWRSQSEDSDTFEVDDSFAFAGGKSLHTRINATDQRRRGGRLFARPDSLGDSMTKLHGRMMMYVGANGVTNHWTFSGVSGPALAPLQGRNATYLFSSLRTMDRNQYSAVNYINTDRAQDCWNRSGEFIQQDKWMCIQWTVDAEARDINLSVDGTEVLRVSGTGQGCVGSVANDSPWIGPNITELYVGTWSFHPADAPLEMWIDEVVVSESPIACPVSE